MMPCLDLKLKINETFSEFLQFYPYYDEFREEILKFTEKRMTERLKEMPEDNMDYWYIEHQLKADITMELLEAASGKKEFSEPMSAIRARNLASIRSCGGPKPSGPSESLQATRSLDLTSITWSEILAANPIDSIKPVSAKADRKSIKYEKKGKVIYLPFRPELF